ncbi:MAG: DoxX family protein [Flavobacteriales bacterium]
MTLLVIAVLLSSLSFFAYVIHYFTAPHMKDEFKRFGIEQLGRVIIALEFLGAVGLLVGLWYDPILTASSLGLALLMLAGLIVRGRLKDSLWISLPALFFLALNGYICWASLLRWA